MKMSSKFCNIEFPLVQVPVWSLKMEEPFRNLFPIRQTVLAEIIDDMNVNGFDFGHPIVVWKMIVVDGHTRLKAAIAAGLETVPVICRQFNDENEALEYAIRCQRNRRNLTNGELLQCLQQLDMRKKAGRPANNSSCSMSRGKSSVDLGETLGISCKKVERLRAINAYATDEIKEALRQGKYSINRAYEETMRSRRPQKKIEPDADAELVHSIMADIHARMNEVQIRKLVKALQIELANC